MKQKYTLFIVWLCVWFWGLCPQMVCAKSKISIPDSLQVLRFHVGDVEFTMQRVEGGVFVMGGTREQHRERITSDLPAHTVSLDAYYIASTEVTQALWQAVMKGWYVSDEWNTPSQPITDVGSLQPAEETRAKDIVLRVVIGWKM